MPPRQQNHGFRLSPRRSGSSTDGNFRPFSGTARRLGGPGDNVVVVGEEVPSGQPDRESDDDLMIDDDDEDDSVMREELVSKIGHLSVVANSWLKQLHRSWQTPLFREIEDFVLRCAVVSSRVTARNLVDNYPMAETLLELQFEWGKLKEKQIKFKEEMEETESSSEECIEPFKMGKHDVGGKRLLHRNKVGDKKRKKEAAESGEPSSAASPPGSTSLVVANEVATSCSPPASSPIGADEVASAPIRADELTEDDRYDEIIWRCYHCREPVPDFVDDAESTCPKCGAEWEFTCF